MPNGSGPLADVVRLLASAQTAPSGPAYSVTDRGASYRVWQRTVPVTNNLTGQITQQLQSYTELGDGMHFWINGAWAESHSIVEVTASGAEAVQGPIKSALAVISPASGPSP